jgi:hypothetical protein
MIEPWVLDKLAPLRKEFTLLTDRAALSDRARLIASSRPAHGSNSAPPETGA